MYAPSAPKERLLEYDTIGAHPMVAQTFRNVRALYVLIGPFKNRKAAAARSHKPPLVTQKIQGEGRRKIICLAEEVGFTAFWPKIKRGINDESQ